MRRSLAILVLCTGCGNDEHVEADAPVAGIDAPAGVDGGPGIDARPDAAGPDAPDYTYGAAMLIGGLDRLVIFRGGDGDCVQLRLVTPSMGGPLMGITTPAMWNVEEALAGPDPTCTIMPPPNPDTATDGTGAVTFGNLSPAGYPCTVDVAVSLTFPGGLEVLDAVGITVADSGC
jgi:hypothetical protein